MYTATIKNVAVAKNGTPAIYCESKSGNIYKLRTPVPAERAPTIIAKIKAAKVINIQHWIKVKEGTFTPKPGAKAKAPRPEYKEVVVKNQAARIKELQAQVKELKNKLEARDEWAEHETSTPEEQAFVDAVVETAVNKRSAAAKKGWATRRANAQQVAS
jgi:hypothetical protein